MQKKSHTFVAAAVFAIVSMAVGISTSVVYSQPHAVDEWLAAHAGIRDALIWEFPPEGEPIDKPIVESPIWRRFEILPYGGIFPGLVLSSYSASLDNALLRRGVSVEVLGEGLDAGRVISTLPDHGGPGPLITFPGELLDFLPGGVQKSEYGAEIRSWWKWPEWAKQELRDRFDAYTLWTSTACPLYAQYAGSNFTVKPVGFDQMFSSVVDVDPAPVVDPPANLQLDDPLVEGSPWPMVSSDDAFALFVRLVAAQLAMEVAGCLPWSVTDYDGPDRATLFDGRAIFRYVPAGPSQWGTMTGTGHIVTRAVTPAPPLVVLGFLGQHGLIGTDRLDTLTRFFDWERQNLSHVRGGTTATPYGVGEFFWLYNGRAPVSRMINGTVMPEPLLFGGGGQFFDLDVHHWVGGCGGAVAFNAAVLRLVNIPAAPTAYGHFQNRIGIGPGQHVGIGHGDDPYWLPKTPEIPTGELLLDDATFQAWFVNESDPAIVSKNVSRRLADLNLAYLPLKLLQLHCLDIASNDDHANSRVYGWAFKPTYSVAEMESMGLWTSIEAKLQSLGGCAAIGF